MSRRRCDITIRGRNRSRLLVGLTAAAVLLLGACGSDDDIATTRNLAIPDAPVVPSISVTGLGDLPGSGSPDDPFVFQAPKDPNDWVEMAMTGVLVDPDGVAVHHRAIPNMFHETLLGTLNFMSCGTNPIPTPNLYGGVSDFVFAGDGDFSSFPCVIDPNTEGLEEQFQNAISNDARPARGLSELPLSA